MRMYKNVLNNAVVSKYANTVVIAAVADVLTLAHEIGHILTNSGHYSRIGGDPEMLPNGELLSRTYLMVAGRFSIRSGGVFDSRRLTQAQEKRLFENPASGAYVLRDPNDF